MKDQKNLKLSVGKRLVNTTLKQIKIKDLHFYPVNPRISSLLIGIKKKLSDNEIHKLMKNKQPEATRTLYRRIKKDQNINEPLIVYGKEVLEGNTRLWVLRELYEDSKNSKEKEKWASVPCRIIDEKISNAEINFILFDVHIKGKRRWDPFEQACYFAKIHEDGMSYHEIAKSTEGVFGYMKVTDYVKAFREMEKRKAKSEEFNYYYETIRQPEVKKEISKGELKVFEVLQKKIKEQKIKTAKDVRKIGAILKDKKAKDQFFKKDADINRAHEIALITNPQEGDYLLKKIKELEEDLRHVELNKIRKWKKDAITKNIILSLKNRLDKILKLKIPL